MLKFSALAVFIPSWSLPSESGQLGSFCTIWLWPNLWWKTGIMAGASLMFFGFLGFESISMTVDEIKEPQKNVPRGIVLALIIVASLYAVVSLVLTGVVHYTKLKCRRCRSLCPSLYWCVLGSQLCIGSCHYDLDYRMYFHGLCP